MRHSFPSEASRRTQTGVNHHHFPAIFQLAALRHGLVSRQQLSDLGCSAKVRRNLVARGLLEQITPEVFAVAGSPSTWDQLVVAALISIGGAARCARSTAAALLKLEGHERRGVVHIVVPRGQRVPVTRIPDGVEVHTTSRLPLLDCASVEGIPVTSAARTIIDLATDGLAPVVLERTIDSAVRGGWTSVTFLRRRLNDLRSPGRTGVRAIDRLLPDSGGHSALERAFLRLVRRAGLPRPTCQRVFTRDGRFVARTDFTFDRRAAVVEVTGKLGHTAPRDRQRDAQRRNELQDIGFKVFEYTYEDVMERPEYVVSTLKERLGLT